MYHKSIQQDKKWQRKLLKCNKILLTRLKWTMQYGNTLLLAHSLVHWCPWIKKRTKLISLRRSCIHIFCCFDCAFTRGSNICQIYSFCRFLPFFIICPARIMTILAILNHRIDLYFDMPKIILLNMNKHRQILKKLHFIDISRQFRGEDRRPNDRCASDRWLCRVFNTCICFQSSLKRIL